MASGPKDRENYNNLYETLTVILPSIEPYGGAELISCSENWLVKIKNKAKINKGKLSCSNFTCLTQSFNYDIFRVVLNGGNHCEVERT